ncbi:MAG: hypothetical protein DRH26_12175 [Deltaproteobacteria bacterium]|nr:MAG: hypothetical protein DRH26_12175 [Deltaproteobacteria bacterium]
MEQKVNIDNLDTARLVCPECNRTETLQLSEYKLTKRHTRVKYKCSCGHTYMAILENKSDPQQDTMLTGTFMSTEDSRYSGRMIIKRLNSKGITLKTDIDQKILPGLNMVLEFVLDDGKQSIVKKQVRVLARNGKYLTAEFTAEEHYDNLGPYLFFNKLYV